MTRWIAGLMLALVTCAHGAALAPAKTVDAAAWMVGRWIDPDGSELLEAGPDGYLYLMAGA